MIPPVRQSFASFARYRRLQNCENLEQDDILQGVDVHTPNATTAGTNSYVLHRNRGSHTLVAIFGNIAPAPTEKRPRI
jgi:hypothetical protein